MFATHRYFQLMKCSSVVLLLVTMTPVYGWQDFPTFDDIMRETDLPVSDRTSNQPVRQPASAWPAIAPQKRSLPDSGRIGDRRGSVERGGSERGGSSTRLAPWEDRPVEQSPNRDRRSLSNEHNFRLGEGSGFDRFRSTTGGQPVGQGTGYDKNDRWSSDNSGGRRSNSGLQDPFGNSRNHPSANGSNDLTTLPPSDTRRSSTGQFRDGQLRDGRAATGSSRPNASGFIYPAGQSRPISRAQPGGAFQDFDSSGTGFEDFGRFDFGAPQPGRPRFDEGSIRQPNRGLDAE